MIKHRPTLHTAPLATVPVVTLAEAKEWLWVTHSEHDSLINSLLASAVTQLDGYSGLLGRCIINQTWVQKFQKWDETLRLPFPDVSSVVLTYYDTDNAEQTVASSNYELLEDEIGSFIKMADDFTLPSLYDDRNDAIKAQFVAGFGAAATNVPEPIKTAIKIMAAHMYANREPVSGTAMTEIPMHLMANIGPYRRIPL